MFCGDESLICPVCGGSDLVRARATRLLWTTPAAKCLVCGERFAVPLRICNGLPPPRLTDPYSAWSDREDYVLRTPMRPVYAGMTVAGTTVGGVALFILAMRLNQPLLGCLILPIALGAWCVGRWLQPPMTYKRVGRCEHCDYPLRAGQNRCSERGHSGVADTHCPGPGAMPSSPRRRASDV